MVIKKCIMRMLLFLTGCFFLANCGWHDKTETKKGNVKNEVFSSNSSYRDPFGKNWLALGAFLKNRPDSVETGLWNFIEETPKICFGDFQDGLPINEWKFILAEGWKLKSNWKIYDNKITATRFSLPFDYEEIRVDSIIFKLKTITDSLGRVSIIYGVHKKMLEDHKRAKFDSGVVSGLTHMGFRFTKERREISNAGSTYYFTEFFMKDSANNNVKCYQMYGNLPSKQGFVEISLYHMGPREELIKILFNMIVNHMYIGDERFYNPYLK